MPLILLDLFIVLLTIDTHVYIYISRARELNLKMTEILKQDYNKTAPFI